MTIVLDNAMADPRDVGPGKLWVAGRPRPVNGSRRLAQQGEGFSARRRSLILSQAVTISASCTAGFLSATGAFRRKNRDELLLHAVADEGVNLPPGVQVHRSAFEGLREAALNGQQPEQPDPVGGSETRDEVDIAVRGKVVPRGRSKHR